MAGGGEPSPAKLAVADPGPSGLTFAASSDRPWLTVAPLQGSAPGTITVRARASDLAPCAVQVHRVGGSATGSQRPDRDERVVMLVYVKS